MKLSKLALVALALTVFGAAAPVGALAAEPVMVGGAPMYANKNIVENAVNSKDHTTLVAAVKAAGLVDTLSGPGPFTVFAPVNAAFDALPPGTVMAAMLARVCTSRGATALATGGPVLLRHGRAGQPARGF